MYPIRVDIQSDPSGSSDSTYRIIDTILVDPSCLPFPYVPTSYLQSCLEREQQNISIQKNAECFANMIISDMEVQSYGKLQKMGRVSLLQIPELVQNVTAQIEKQLKEILWVREPQRLKKMRGVRKRTFDSDVPIKDELLKIILRIREESITVVDEFTIDPNDENLSNPILIAESIATDLNIPSCVISPSVAISIAEQLCGLKMQDDCTGLTYGSPEDRIGKVPKRIQVERTIPTVWKMDDKEAAIVKKHYLSVGVPNSGAKEDETSNEVSSK